MIRVFIVTGGLVEARVFFGDHDGNALKGKHLMTQLSPLMERGQLLGSAEMRVAYLVLSHGGFMAAKVSLVDGLVD